MPNYSFRKLILTFQIFRHLRTTAKIVKLKFTRPLARSACDRQLQQPIEFDFTNTSYVTQFRKSFDSLVN